MKEFNPKSMMRLDNATCPYCYEKISRRKSEKEHVIGRNFVPKGSLNAQWNLIVRSCNKCNQEKSLLENDLSVITMWPSPTETEIDKRLIEEIRRRRKAKSARTGKWVSESEESSTIKAQIMQGCESTFGFTGPPQFDRDRVAQLARFHVAAFFYLMTYDRPSRIGHPIHSGLLFDSAVRKSDWGNPRLLGFQDLIADWSCRAHAVGADGYFKLIIRRNLAMDENTPLWAWAVEWNKGVRAFGFFGDREQVQKTVDQLPILQMKVLEQGVDPEKGPYTRRFREEIRLMESDDRLFEVSEE